MLGYVIGMLITCYEYSPAFVITLKLTKIVTVVER